eukprot:gene2239-biopygen2002
MTTNNNSPKPLQHPAEQPVTLPLNQMLQLQLQKQQAQQQAISTLQVQQGTQFWPYPTQQGARIANSDGKTRAQFQQHKVNNSWVVPHNIKLLLKFDCHINVEASTVKSVKYIFKYIQKENDMAHFEIREDPFYLQTSFEDIRTVDGVTHDTFKNATRAKSLLEDDAEHKRCLQHAAIIHMPAQMRQLFATIILCQTPNNINALFTKFQEDMADDYARHDELQDRNAAFQLQHIHMCLADIQNNLYIHGKSLQDFPKMLQLPANYACSQQADGEINIK